MHGARTSFTLIPTCCKTPARYGAYAVRVGARALAAGGDLAAAQAVLGGVLQADPRNSFAWSDLARVRYSAGDVRAAGEAAARAVAIDPGNLEAQTLRGELVRSQYGLVAALPWFEAVLKRDAYYHPALIEYAATLGDAGRHLDMLAATRRALAARPGSAQAYYLQAVLAARAGRNDLARGLLARTGGQLDGLPGALLLGGTLDYAAGGYEQAIEKWRELVGRQPMNVVARKLLGAALLRSGDARGALDVLRPVALRADADRYTLTLVGRAFERTGERDWAARFLDRAAFPQAGGSTPFGAEDSLPVLQSVAAASPGDPVAALGYVRGLVDSGNVSGAVSAARSLAARMPGAPAAWAALGDALAAGGRFGEAAGAYRRAADLRFDEPILLRLVDATDRAGDRTGAANALALYLSQNPQSIAAARLSAHWMIAAGQWDAAIERLEDLRARLGNRDAALLAELAAAYAGDGDDLVAMRYARAAYDLAPMNPGAADAYGWALYGAGKAGAAVQVLEKAVAIAPVPALRWHLAQAYADAGAKNAARAQIALALADPRFVDRAAAKAVLAAL
jgi:cellulose synthase operon protein C